MGNFVQFLANYSKETSSKTTDQKSFIFGLEFSLGAYFLSFLNLPHTSANDQCYDVIMVVANQNETSHIGLIHE